LQVAALLGELTATRSRATQAEAEKARAVAAAAAAAALPPPAAADDSKRLLGQLAVLNDEVRQLWLVSVMHLFDAGCSFAAFSSLIFLQISQLRGSRSQVEAEAAALREEIAKYRREFPCNNFIV
jgi:hypothetical protein